MDRPHDGCRACLEDAGLLLFSCPAPRNLRTDDRREGDVRWCQPTGCGEGGGLLAGGVAGQVGGWRVALRMDIWVCVRVGGPTGWWLGLWTTEG